MVQIDMELPSCCMDCPCSYWIRTGPNADKLMCNVMEYNGAYDPIVEDHQRDRPTDCPMREVDIWTNS